MPNVLLPCAHRWLSLVIEFGIGPPFLNMILENIRNTSFPSLRHFPIKGTLSQTYKDIPQFCSGNSPQLKHLELGSGFNGSNSQVPLGLTSLSLDLRVTEQSSIFQQLALQNLAVLILKGSIHVRIDPNSIHLPLLEKFVCEMSGGEMGLCVLLSHQNLLPSAIPRRHWVAARWKLTCSTPPHPSTLVLPTSCFSR